MPVVRGEVVGSESFAPFIETVTHIVGKTHIEPAGIRDGRVGGGGDNCLAITDGNTKVASNGEVGEDTFEGVLGRETELNDVFTFSY